MNKVKFKKGTQKKYPVRNGHQPEKQVKINRYYDLVGLVIIILLGIIIYSNSFRCSFQFDDSRSIVDNLSIRNLSNVKAWWNFSPNRPIGMFTFALNYHFNQLDVRYYHVVNFCIHLINAVLVWWLTLMIFSSPLLEDHQLARHKKVIAFFTALLFVSHPLATQSVTYIVQRHTSLAALFYLLSLALYAQARLHQDKGIVFKTLLFSGTLISAVLAMLTKENAFTLPFAIVLFELFFIKTKKLSINFKDYRVILMIAVFLGLILIIPLKYSFNVFKPLPPSVWHSVPLTPLNYLLTEFSVIVRYIRLLFLPINQNVDYDFPDSTSFFEIRTLLSFMVILSLIILAIFLSKRNRVISFGIFWFFLTLSVESSIIPINDVIFEHRTYLPSFGFFLILSSIIFVFLWERYKLLAISILVIITGSNSFLTYERNKVWKDPLSLWSDVVSKSPDKARPITSRGDCYLDLGQWDKAIADYSRAIQLKPYYAKAWCNRGVVYGKLEQWDKAIADYSTAIGIEPGYTKALFNRGISYGSLGQWTRAIDDYSRAIGNDPDYYQAWSNRGIAWDHLGQWNKAIADYSRVIEINPDFSKAWYNRAIAYGNLGQWDNAITDYSRSISIDPEYATAWYNRGIAYGNLGQWDKAIADYSRTIRIEPNNIQAYSNRGIAYWNLGQQDKAIADYTRAIGINPKYTTAYFNLGISYGYLAQWDKAIAEFSKVLEIDPDNTKAYTNREVAYRKLSNRIK